MSNIELRLAKAQGFAASIEANVNSKVEITDSLSRRLETFVTMALRHRIQSFTKA